jgi:hypothetical protein
VLEDLIVRSVRQRLLQILPTLERGDQSLERPLLFVSAGGVDHELPVSGDEVSGRRWGGDFGLVMAASRVGQSASSAPPCAAPTGQTETWLY